MKIYVERDILRRSYSFTVLNEDQNKQYFFDIKVSEKQIPEWGIEAEPSLIMPSIPGLWPALLEALQDAGLLTDSRAAIAELKATKYHLEDMRKLGLKNE